jgi:hypothetical protein
MAIWDPINFESLPNSLAAVGTGLALGRGIPGQLQACDITRGVELRRLPYDNPAEEDFAWGHVREVEFNLG